VPLAHAAAQIHAKAIVRTRRAVIRCSRAPNVAYATPTYTRAAPASYAEVVADLFAGAQRRFVPSVWPGVEVCSLHDHPEGGGSALFRMRAGASIHEHAHPRGEHTYVIRGRARFGDREVETGDVLWTHPGERHTVVAVTDVEFLGVAPPEGE
jgi:quercetin dioxygenase-like cupin family protein